MDDLTLFQWLVLGLLASIGVILLIIGLGVERDLETMTRRIEVGLENVREEVRHRGAEPNRTISSEDNLADLLDDDIRAKLERARERIKLRGDES